MNEVLLSQPHCLFLVGRERGPVHRTRPFWEPYNTSPEGGRRRLIFLKKGQRRRRFLDGKCCSLLLRPGTRCTPGALFIVPQSCCVCVLGGSTQVTQWEKKGPPNDSSPPWSCAAPNIFVGAAKKRATLILTFLLYTAGLIIPNEMLPVKFHFTRCR
jgi:hypothetical protein